MHGEALGVGCAEGADGAEGQEEPEKAAPKKRYEDSVALLDLHLTYLWRVRDCPLTIFHHNLPVSAGLKTSGAETRRDTQKGWATGFPSLGECRNHGAQLQSGGARVGVQVHGVDYYAGAELADPDAYSARPLEGGRLLRGPRPEEGEQAADGAGATACRLYGCALHHTHHAWLAAEVSAQEHIAKH